MAVRPARLAIPVFGAVWACALGAIGLTALGTPGMRLALPPPTLAWFTLMALAGAQFVFMTLVADRWMSRASRGFVDLCEALVFVVFLVGCLGFVAVFLALRLG